MTKNNKEIKLFDEDGEATIEIAIKKELQGEEAFAFLASEFAGTTHGNYNGETLYLRAKLQNRYEIILKSKQ